MKNYKKFIFIIQGEGRGHVTQAISLYQTIVSAGHSVHHVIIGKNPTRKIPAFVRKNFECSITEVQSPSFVLDKNGKGIRPVSSMIQMARDISSYKKSMHTIKNVINEIEPDAIINFYDPLISALYLFKKPNFKIISVAHQNIFLHKHYQFPSGDWFQKQLLKNYTKFISRKTNLTIALSLYPLSSQKNILVTPPLLRKSFYTMTPNKGDYILCYVVNEGYLNEVTKWQKENNHVTIHVFSDRAITQDVKEVSKNLFLHKIDDRKFLEMMKNCTAFASTAGFESVAEALYLGKPSMVVPIANHYEQYCNAHDAVFAGGSVWNNTFHFDKLIHFTQNEFALNAERKKWMAHSAQTIMKHIEDTLEL